MTTRLLRRTAALIALLVAAPVTATSLAPPAVADDPVQVITDPAGDARLADVDRLDVTYTADRLVLRISPAPGSNAARFVDVYLDHDRSDPGPELRMSADQYSESTHTAAVERFPRGQRPSPGRTLCRDLPFRLVGPREQTIVMSAPTRCLGAAPEAFRLSMRTAQESDPAGDVVPDGRWSRTLRRAAPPAPPARVVRDRGGVDDSRVRADGISYGELRSLRVRWTDGRLVTRFVPAGDTGPADHYDLYADTDRDGSPDVRVRWDRTRDARFATAYRTDGYSPRLDPDAVLCARVPRR